MLQRPIYAYHEPSNTFALAGGSRTIYLWKLEDSADVAGREEIRRPQAGRSPAATLRLHSESLRGLFFQDATTLIGVHSSGNVAAWRVDWDRGVFLDEPVWLLDLQTTVTAFAARAWQEGVPWRIAVGGDRGRVFVLDQPLQPDVDNTPAPANSPVVSLGHVHTEAVISFAFDGDRIASGARDRMVHLWVMPTGALAGEFGAIGSGAQPEDEETPSVATKSLTHVQALGGCQGWPLALGFSQNGQKLAAGCMDNGLYCWKVDGVFLDTPPQHLASFVHDGWVSDVAFSPDDLVLATACWDHSVGLFDAESLMVRHHFHQHRDYAVKVLFVPDTDVLLSASYDQTIAVWDWKKMRPLDVLVGHRDWVGDLVLLRDGLVAGVTSDHSVCVWSTRDWRLVEMLGPSLYGDFAPVESVDLSEFVALTPNSPDSLAREEEVPAESMASYATFLPETVPVFEEEGAALVEEIVAEAVGPKTVEVASASQVQAGENPLVVDVIDLILDAFSESEESEPLFLGPVSSPLFADSSSDRLRVAIDEKEPAGALTEEKFQSIFEAIANEDAYLIKPEHREMARAAAESMRESSQTRAVAAVPEGIVMRGEAKPSEVSGLFGLPGVLTQNPFENIAPTRLAAGLSAERSQAKAEESLTRELYEHHLDEDLSVPELDSSASLASSSQILVVEAELEDILGDVTWNVPGMGIVKRRPQAEDAEYQPFLQIRTPHRAGVRVGLSTAGEKLLSGGAGPEVCVWHSRGQLEYRFSLPSEAGVGSVEFLAGGTIACVMGTDHNVHLWLLPRTMLGRPGRALHAVLSGHRGALTSAAVHTGGRLLLTGSQDMSARLWCLKTGTCLAVLRGHTGAVTGVAFGSHGPVTIGSDGRVNLWDMHGTQIDQLDLAVPLLGLASLGGELCWAAASGAVYRMREGSTRPMCLTGHYGQARSVAFGADGSLVTAGEDGKVFVYGAGDETPRQEIALPDSIGEVRLSDSLLVAACEGGTVYLFRRGFK